MKVKSVFSSGISLDILTTLQGRSGAQENWPTQNKFNGNFVDLLFHFALFGYFVSNLLVFVFFLLFLLLCFCNLFFPVVYFERETKDVKLSV